MGRGAMGVTYRALDTVLGHAVALKVIDARIASRHEARARFLREARAAARLRHPNVASVFYYGVRILASWSKGCPRLGAQHFRRHG
jgi:serine/threonine protein kinase